MTQAPSAQPPLLTDSDAWLLGEGSHLRPYEVMGARLATVDGVAGTRFSVWAPNASRVAVVGEWEALGPPEPRAGVRLAG